MTVWAASEWIGIGHRCAWIDARLTQDLRPGLYYFALRGWAPERAWASYSLLAKTKRGHTDFRGPLRSENLYAGGGNGVQPTFVLCAGKADSSSLRSSE